MTRRLAEAAIAAAALVVATACVRDFAADEPLGVCEVHHVPLTTLIVPLEYGLEPPIGNAFATAFKLEFPHARPYVNGGCVVNHWVTRARVRACLQCNKAHAQWVKEHPRYDQQYDVRPGAAGEARAKP